jgi:hypothetical protein
LRGIIRSVGGSFFASAVAGDVMYVDMGSRKSGSMPRRRLRHSRWGSPASDENAHDVHAIAVCPAADQSPRIGGAKAAPPLFGYFIDYGTKDEQTACRLGSGMNIPAPGPRRFGANTHCHKGKLADEHYLQLHSL